MLGKYEREFEQRYSHTKYIVEFYNTISNLPFILIGLYRLGWLYNNPEFSLNTNMNHIYILYSLCICAGLCSAYHHMNLTKKTIIIDWIPLLFTAVYLLYNSYLLTVLTIPSLIAVSTAFTVLLLDHTTKIFPSPIGHVMWHLLAALAVDMTYMDILYG